MSSTAFQTAYRQEIINGFDKTQSVLRGTVTTAFQDKGASVVFLTSDTAGINAVTRGVNGEIPGRPLNLTQNTCTLLEWHDKPIVTGYNVFASQGDLTMEMQRSTMLILNKRMDKDIIDQLAVSTNVVNTTAIVATVGLILKAGTILQNNFVQDDGDITLLATPAMIAYLRQTNEFSNQNFVTKKPFAEGGPAFGDKRPVYKWNNWNIISDASLPGNGTAAEKCFLYHKNAIGHAIKTGDLDISVGYDEQDDYSFARCKGYMAAKLLSNAGVAVINHDGSAFAAS